MISSLKVLSYRIHLKEFLLIFIVYLLAEQCFSWLLAQNAQVTGIGIKVLSILIYAYIFTDLRSFTTGEKIYIGIFTLWMIKLVFESLIFYGAPFRHFEIYTVIFPVIYTLFIKSVMRKLNADLLGFLAGFYVVVYLLFMALFGQRFSFSLEHIEPNTGPFSGDTRIIHAHSIFMMIIPYLWYLNEFITRQKLKPFLLFTLCFTIIVVHQHRSVWSSAILATLVYFVLVLRTNRKSVQGLAAFATIFFLATIIALYYISDIAPQLLDMFSERFNEILNPEKTGGTGGFRFEQREAYLEYISQKPFFGWSFGGYELENPLVDWWDANTGHHFHESFIEILFYHGLFGLLLKFSFIIYIIIKAFNRRLSGRLTVLIPFCICGLIFSLNYVLPLVFWAHTGMCLWYIEKNEQ